MVNSTPLTKALIFSFCAGTNLLWQFQYFSKVIDYLERPAQFPNPYGFRTKLAWFEMAGSHNTSSKKCRLQYEAIFGRMSELPPNVPLIDNRLEKKWLSISYSVWSVCLIIIHFCLLRYSITRRKTSLSVTKGFPLGQFGMKIAIFTSFIFSFAEYIRGMLISLLRRQWPQIEPSLSTQLWLLGRLKWISLALVCWFHFASVYRYFFRGTSFEEYISQRIEYKKKMKSLKTKTTKKNPNPKLSQCYRCLLFLQWQNRQLGSIAAIIPTLYFVTASLLTLASIFKPMQFLVETATFTMILANVASFIHSTELLRRRLSIHIIERLSKINKD